jgi:hypothetical protein
VRAAGAERPPPPSPGQRALAMAGCAKVCVCGPVQHCGWWGCGGFPDWPWTEGVSLTGATQGKMAAGEGDAADPVVPAEAGPVRAGSWPGTRWACGQSAPGRRR